VVFPARVFHVKSRVSCGLIPLLVVVYSPSFITLSALRMKPLCLSMVPGRCGQGGTLKRMVELVGVLSLR
jgi:hypothetical protein